MVGGAGVAGRRPFWDGAFGNAGAGDRGAGRHSRRTLVGPEAIAAVLSDLAGSGPAFFRVDRQPISVGYSKRGDATQTVVSAAKLSEAATRVARGHSAVFGFGAGSVEYYSRDGAGFVVIATASDRVTVRPQRASG